MPTALAEWTTERPDEPGFYWWMRPGEVTPEVVRLELTDRFWTWYAADGLVPFDQFTPIMASLWWPVRLDPPPVG
jgi:hypothetical protein